MKKIVSVLLIAVFVFTVFPVYNINADAANSVEAPVFSVSQVASSDGYLKVNFNLESGTFNSLDLNLVTSSGLACVDIVQSSACTSNGWASTNITPANGAFNFSMMSSTGYSVKGTVFTATFQVTNTRLEEYSVTVKIGECTVSQTVNGELTNVVVTPANPVFTKRSLAVSVTSLPSKTTYCVGQSLDKTGLVVKAEYLNGTSKTITNYNTSYDFNSAGKKSVKISYSEGRFNAETSFEVTVKEHTLGAIKTVKEVNCTENGLKEQYCTVCGKLCYSEVITAQGHKFEVITHKRPTFNTTGENRKVCSVCKYIGEYITVPKLSADIDGNGKVTSRDALFILQHTTGVKPLTGSALTNADLDGSGDIKSKDALTVLQIATGLVKV